MTPISNLIRTAIFIVTFMPHLALAFDPKDVSMGVDPAALDRSVDPCTDFYQYSCGNWLKGFDLPADQSRWTRSFTGISEGNLSTLKDIVEKDHGKLGTLYQSCMKEEVIESGNRKSLDAALSILVSFKEKKDLAAVISVIHRRGGAAFFRFGRDYDLKNPRDAWISAVAQGGYTLPDTDYYRGTEDSQKKIREALKQYMEKIFGLNGSDAESAKNKAQAVFKIEDRLAQAGLPPEELQDATTLYHLKEMSYLKSTLPSLSWEEYFKGLGLPIPKIINVTEERFFTALEKTLSETSVEDLKSYLEYRILQDSAPYLGKTFQDPWFDFNKKTLNGQKERQPRWKECVRHVGDLMDESLGGEFVKRLFSAKAKSRAKTMISNLELAFKQNLGALPWLDEATRKAALNKLSKFDQKIGYPEKWKDYSKLKLDQKDFLANAMSASKLEEERQLKTIGTPVDLKEWGMPPQQVNAYYDPSLNQINFPAAILQPPFFSERFPDSYNYGAIGMVIGHEISHGFDTSGSKFDGDGVMNNWWSNVVKTNFDQKAACLIDQYSGFEVLPGLKVNGKLTITENIADNAGLKVAYLAFQLSKKGRKATSAVAGLTEEQQFFVSHAQAWCTKTSDAYLRKQVSGDPHSPSVARVNGPVMNNEFFSEAFKCESGKPMAPKNRCLVW
jgi:predicted metalloendopeptidase